MKLLDMQCLVNHEITRHLMPSQPMKLLDMQCLVNHVMPSQPMKLLDI